jgi:hypothetical protein
MNAWNVNYKIEACVQLFYNPETHFCLVTLMLSKLFQLPSVFSEEAGYYF